MHYVFGVNDTYWFLTTLFKLNRLFKYVDFTSSQYFYGGTMCSLVSK